MMGRTHAASGVVAGLAVCAVADLPAAFALAVAPVYYLSALGPDIDHPQSTAARCLGPISGLASRAVRAVSVRATGMAHRGLAHSLAAAVVYGGLVGGLSAPWLLPMAALWLGLSAAFGYGVGLAGDIPTRQSLQWVWWPVRTQSAWPRWARLTTGRTAERWIFRALVVGGVLLLPAALSS